MDRSKDWKSHAQADLGSPMRHYPLLILLAVLSLVPAFAGEPLGTFTKNSVTVVLTLEPGPVDGQAVLVGVFTPKPKDLPLHLYSKDLVGTIGVATKLALKAGQSAEATGPLTVDQETHLLEELPVYPEGPVTLKLPIRLPVSEDGKSVQTVVLVSYMACSARIV